PHLHGEGEIAFELYEALHEGGLRAELAGAQTTGVVDAHAEGAAGCRPLTGPELDQSRTFLAIFGLEAKLEASVEAAQALDAGPREIAAGGHTAAVRPAKLGARQRLPVPETLVDADQRPGRRAIRHLRVALAEIQVPGSAAVAFEHQLDGRLSTQPIG